ncbi:MAG: peptide chain release factor N(5)-glutamine methyltransferase [Candidatus Krumholzibacteriota bacterium]|nr:peptide chain release factor N(5)-glutamine methyltransferase [Candidatus Krumholzibacteriota bacterium]
MAERVDARAGGEAERPTIVEAIRLAEGYLQRNGVPAARTNAEHLLAAGIGCSRLDLYLRFDRKVEPAVLAAVRENLRLRATRYPLQYILGEIEFFSLPFRVREGVFIPRPETELLVERVERLFFGRDVARFVEFGTGSGVIAATLAARHPGWRGAAFDRDPGAAHLALENCRALGIGDRVSVFVADGFGAVRANGQFDLLVSNPPYVPTERIEALEAEVSRFESRLALDGGEEGTDLYPGIAAAGAALLCPGGVIALEIGDGQKAVVEAILAGAGFEKIETTRDHNGLERVVTAARPA